MLAPTRPIKPTYRQVALYTLAQHLGPMCTAGLTDRNVYRTSLVHNCVGK
ncbi:unnamed protein product [Leptidea sinapis]|uniref:Uncharacterized protein n=1 Tax=Leptidea sinapis TaxID=189913 RepID=A0A5E4QPX2_9NEOP|nr:unnamed protein product [Leptidea sinapis]